MFNELAHIRLETACKTALRLGLIVFALFSMRWATALAADQQQPDKFSGLYLRYDRGSDNYYDLGIEWASHWSIADRKLWLSQRFGGISAVHQKTEAYIVSFQGPVGLTSAFFGKLLNKATNSKAEFYQSPLFILLALPNSQFEYALTDNFLIGMRNNTEYLFARGHHGERGIEYSWALTLAYWKYTFGNETSDCIGLQIHAGKTNFLNFEGDNRDRGWTFGGAVFFMFVDH